MNRTVYNNLQPAKKSKSRLNKIFRSRTTCYLVKRVFDIFISALVITFLLSWLLPLLALLIVIDSRGPVFFIQRRIGAKGRIFTCFKLRSMVVNEHANLKQAKANDPRITTFGRFLRNSNLDELPQFFNVLMGDMSIVGPRPHMIRDCEDFSRIIPNYEYRHLVKPGITGMAQVKGYRGETNCFYDISHRYKWDVFYVKNSSFLLDLKIIHKTSLQTVSVIMKHSGNKLTQTSQTHNQPQAQNKPLIKMIRKRLVEA